MGGMAFRSSAAGIACPISSMAILCRAGGAAVSVRRSSSITTIRRALRAFRAGPSISIRAAIPTSISASGASTASSRAISGSIALVSAARFKMAIKAAMGKRAAGRPAIGANVARTRLRQTISPNSAFSRTSRI